MRNTIYNLGIKYGHKHYHTAFKTLNSISLGCYEKKRGMVTYHIRKCMDMAEQTVFYTIDSARDCITIKCDRNVANKVYRILIENGYNEKDYRDYNNYYDWHPTATVIC